MSFNYNRVTMAGNLTRDPEVKFLPNDKAVAQFGIAINRKFKGPDGSAKEETTFVDVEAWGRTAELVGQYLTKGAPCFLDGRLRLDSWEDKKTGEKRSKIKVVADSVQFLGGKRDGQTAPTDDAAPAPARPQVPTGGGGGGDDQPPFMRHDYPAY